MIIFTFNKHSHSFTLAYLSVVYHTNITVFGLFCNFNFCTLLMCGASAIYGFKFTVTCRVGNSFSSSAQVPPLYICRLRTYISNYYTGTFYFSIYYYY